MHHHLIAETNGHGKDCRKGLLKRRLMFASQHWQSILACVSSGDFAGSSKASLPIRISLH
jgi:hypothetical protein